MRDTFHNVSKAFTPFFTDVIEISGKRNTTEFKTSLNACVFPIEDVDTFSDVDLQTDLKKIKVIFQIMEEDGWCREDKPNVGDEIELQDGSKWKVSKANLVLECYELEARSK